MKVPKILIVDDQQTSINLLKTQLEEYNIYEANSGRVALKLIQEEKPDVILLDVMMPGIDGYSVLSIVKSAPETRMIPVLVVTALGGTDDKAKFLDRGADGYVTKPVNPVELRDKVRSLFGIKALRDELYQAQQTLIKLTYIFEEKDRYQTGHCRRTAIYAVRLARKELLQPLWQEEIKNAALLHDIGKVGIRESLFLKPGNLTAEEFEEVKQHVIIGQKICSSLKIFEPILPFIRHHHERYDGTGYPDGLKGKEIPIGARIIAVADAYDALTSERPYRRAYTQDEALQIFKDNAGSHWDPEIVELLCELAKMGSLNAEREGT
jgi:putative two-component system response regulator